MATVFCKNCGAEIEESAKFCRRCGAPSPLLEVTTRSLDPPLPADPLTRPVGALETAPGPPAPPPASWTNPLKPASQKPLVFILAGVAALLFIALVGALIYIAVNESDPADVPVIEVPMPPPPPPGHPAQPPGHPPLPPGAPSPPLDPEIARQIPIYPGAKTLNQMGVGDQGYFLQLQTSDGAEKVIAWYAEKIKPTEQVSLPGRHTVMKAASLSVMVGATPEGTWIIIAREPKER